MSLFAFANTKRTAGTIGWKRSKESYCIGSMETKTVIAVLKDKSDQEEADAIHLVRCWNACQGMKPEAVKESMVLIHALPTLLKDPKNIANIAERVSELIALSKEE